MVRCHRAPLPFELRFLISSVSSVSKLLFKFVYSLEKKMFRTDQIRLMRLKCEHLPSRIFYKDLLMKALLKVLQSFKCILEIWSIKVKHGHYQGVGKVFSAMY